VTDPKSSEPELRDREVMLKVPRTMAGSHNLTQAELLRERQDPNRPLPARAADYLKIRVFEWIWHYIRSRFGPKHEFLTYPGSGNDRGIYPLTADEGAPRAPVRVELVGDWGTGTRDAQRIAQLMVQRDPHFTVHLGDVYYVGTKKEIRENMLERVRWPLGSRGSFSLNSNHEMYARGFGYFKVLLPALGFRASGNDGTGQRASFFCLRNDHWAVIGLDTGYYSVGIPALEKIFKPSAKLHDRLLDWLKKDVRLQEDKQRGIILLSHHQYYSQWESHYERAARQLSDLVNRPVMWFWGHEHRMAVYGAHATKKGRLTVFGRCIGHGGMPIEDIKDLPRNDKKHRVGLVLYDARRQTSIGDKNTPIGYNGFAELVFKEDELEIGYHDSDNQYLLREVWRAGDGGRITGVSIESKITDPGFVLYGSKLEDAIS